VIFPILITRSLHPLNISHRELRSKGKARLMYQ
jgi:hypothetical protein